MLKVSEEIANNSKDSIIERINARRVGFLRSKSI